MKTLLAAALALVLSMASGADAQPARRAVPVSGQQQQAIAANAALVQEKLGPQSGIAFDYGPRSVEWLDGFISRTRVSMKEPGRLPQVLGSYLGEAIRRRDGGTWIRESDGTVGLELAKGFVVYPLNKVEKHFANGDGDSIYALYQSIPALLAAQKSGGLGRR